MVELNKWITTSAMMAKQRRTGRPSGPFASSGLIGHSDSDENDGCAHDDDHAYDDREGDDGEVVPEW